MSAMRPRWFLPALLVLAGCGGKKPPVAPPPPVPPAPAVPAEVDAGELFTKPLPEGVQARVTRREYTGYVQGGHFMIDGDYQFFLTITNRTESPVRARCPTYLLGTFPTWKNHYASEAKSPEFLYFIAVRDGAFRIPPGGEARVEIQEARYLGNTNRPPPAGPGMEPELAITVPPPDSPYVIVATALAQEKPPLEPWFHGLAYSLIADASPDDIQRKRMLAWAWVGIDRLRAVLDRTGVKPRLYGCFAEATAKRNGILEKLRAAPDAVQAVRILDSRSCKGDAEIAKVFTTFLQPDPNRREKSPMPYCVGGLEVRDPAILDALFRFAIRDGHEFSRIEAAIQGAQLGDPRCVPLLVQYSRNPAMADGDVSQLAMRCTGVLVDLWLAQGKYQRSGDWKAAIARHGGMDVPDLKGISAEDRAELNAFLESGRNLRVKAEK